MIDRKVFDDFLDKETFEYISEIVMTCKHDRQILWQIQNTVAEFDDKEETMPPWNWMGIAIIYSQDEVRHPFFDEIRDKILPVIKEKVFDYKSIVRVKTNFYPWTQELKHHRYHTDLDWQNVAAVLSLNTCDGYTEFEDGQTVKSIANRLVVFNGQDSHRSTTTSTTFGRFNINFNLL